MTVERLCVNPTGISSKAGQAKMLSRLPAGISPAKSEAAVPAD
jgi:hypothetical protein